MATRPKPVSGETGAEGAASAADAARDGAAGGRTAIAGGTVLFGVRIPSHPVLRWTNPLPHLERLFKREEADVILLAGNLALVVLEVVEWPVAALTLLVHGLARTRYKALEALAEVAEEAE